MTELNDFNKQFTFLYRKKKVNLRYWFTSLKILDISIIKKLDLINKVIKFLS